MEKIFNAGGMKSRRQLLRNNMPKAEWRLWEHLRKSQLENIKFRRQTSIGSFVVDFFAPSIGLIIEVDGDSHIGRNVEAYDSARTETFSSLGLRVIRFTNDEVFDDLENVLRKIQMVVSHHPQPLLREEGSC